jgi:hypothetical protein
VAVCTQAFPNNPGLRAICIDRVSDLFGQICVPETINIPGLGNFSPVCIGPA